MEEKLQKIYLTYYSLLIARDLWQDHYQILSMIFLKKFTKLNVNTGTMIKNAKTYEIKYRYGNYFREYTNFKDDLIEYICRIYFCCNKHYQQRLDEKLKEWFFNHYVHKVSPWGPKHYIFGNQFYLKDTRMLRFHEFLHFHARKHMISSFYLKWTAWQEILNFVLI